MVLTFIIGLTASLAVYGAMCYWAGRAISRRAAGRGWMAVVAFALSMIGLWIPSVVVCFFTVGLLPLNWGHAGEMIIMSGAVGGFLVFAAMLLRFSEEIASGREKTALANESVPIFRCGSCSSVISSDAASCPICGFEFGKTA